MPTGTVTFKDAGVNIAGCVGRPLGAGTTTCVTSGSSVGAHIISGVYSGDGNFNPSTSPNLTQTVNKGSTTTAVTSSANPSVSGQNVTYTATVTVTAPASGTPTGTVNFRDGGVTIAGCGAQAVSVAGTATCTATYAGPGSHTISGVYSGDGNFNPSTSPNLTQTVNKGSTATAVTSSANPSVSGQSVTYTATVMANAPGSGTPTGTVTFQDGGVNIAGCVNRGLLGGVATCSSTSAVVGPNSITANYNGDANFLTSTSAPLTQTVNQDSTTTTLSSSTNPSVVGQSVTFTANVTANAPGSGTRTGTVDFQDAGVTIAGCGARAVAVAGTATCTVTYAGPGSHTISGVYSGDVNFSPSTSAPLIQIVNIGNTATAVTSSVNPSVSGQNVTYTATVTATAPASGTRTGTVDFRDAGVTIAGCGAQVVSVAGKATCTVAYAGPGSHSISGVYSGDGNFNPSTSPNLTQTVNKGSTTTAVTSSVNPSVSGQSVTYTATVTATLPASGTRTGTVDFRDAGVSIAGCGAQVVAVAGTATCAVAYAGPGSHTISGVYSGDANFNTSTSPNLTQTVNKGNTTTAVTSSVNPSVSGQNVTYTATVTATAPASGTRTGTVDFQDGGVTIAGCGAQAVSVAGKATCTVAYAGPGSHSITAIYNGDPDFLPSTSATLTQTVNKGSTTTAVTSSANPSVSGQSVTFTANVTANAPGSGTRTGTVDFQDAGVTIAGCGARAVAVAGTATCVVTYAGPGSHTISAVYSGDGNFNPSTSPNLTQTVNKGSTATAVTSSANPSVSGQSVTFTANVTANAPGSGTRTGTVDFQDAGVTIAGCGARAVAVAGTATCTVTYAGPGSHTISGVYSGDVNFSPSTSAPLIQIVNIGNTATAVTSSVNPSVSGQNVTYTATVTATAPASGTRTGTVDFRDAGVTIAGCGAQVVSVAGKATCTVTYAGPGSHSISGVYSGDGNFNPSTSPNLTQTVNKGSTTTAVTSSVNPSVSGQNVTYTATVTATAPASGTRTGTVDFRDAGVTIAGCGAQVVSVAGKATCTVAYAGPGSHSISGVYSGDGNFNPSTSPNLTQTVNKGSTTTAVTSSVNPSVSGQNVTYTATVTATAPASGTRTGTVDFRDAGVTIAGCGAQVVSVAGKATCTVAYAGPGSHSITAIYNGDPDFLPSTSATLTQTVNKGSTTTAVTSSANPSVSGQSVTYTATVMANAPGSGTPTGTVTFQDGGVDIAGCVNQAVVGGTATCGVTYPGVGSHSITAIYNGDPDFLPGTSATLTQTVNQDATTTTVTSSVNPSVSGQSVTYTATVTANAPGSGTPTGTVDFQDGGVSIAGCVNQAVVGGTATCGVTYPGVGSHRITAIYNGDPDFLPGTSATLTQTVNQDATTTTVTSSVNPSVSGQSVTYTATVMANAPGSGTPTGTVTFQDGGVDIAGCVNQAVVGGTATCGVTYPGVGSHRITAIYNGDPDFLPGTSATLTQTVNQDATTTTVTSSVNPSVSGQSVTYTATVMANAPGSGTPTGTVTFQDGGVDIAGCVNQAVVGGTATCGVTYPGVGSHRITAIYSGDGNFNPSTSPNLTQTVNKGSTTTAVTSSVNPSVSGQSVTYTATVMANAPGSGTPTGTVTFQDGGVDIAGCVNQAVVGGTATCGVTYPGVGSHRITAIYNGDPDFLPGTSATLTQTVNRDATTTTVTSSVNPSVSGQSVTYTATVMANAPGSGTPTGTVTFQDGGVDIAGCVNQAVVGGTATCGPTWAGAGSHTIAGIYSGDINFLTSTPVSITELILPGLPKSGRPAGADAARAIPPEGLPGVWLAMLALIAGLAGLGMAAIVRRHNGARVRQV